MATKEGPKEKGWKENIGLGRYLYNQFAERLVNPEAWDRLTEEVQAELKEAVGDISQNGYEAVSAVAIFTKTTGGLPRDKESRLELFRLMGPVLQGQGKEVFLHLSKFMQASQAMNMASMQERGAIKPELVAILNDSYTLPEETYKQRFMAREGNILSVLLDEGKLDFKPFKGKKDKAEDWYFDYNIRTSPLPVKAGYPALTLNGIIQTAGQEYVAVITKLKDTILLSLHGVKASDGLLKTVKNITADADGYIRRPVEPEAMLQFAEAVEKQYQQRQKERTRRDYAAPFTSAYEAGFYVNPVTCEIHDLRPYHKDLHELFSIQSWRYLKDFVAAVREAVTEFQGEERARKQKTPPPSVFEKDYAKMFNFVLTNQIVNVITTNPGRQQKTSKLKALTVDKGQGIKKTVHQFRYREIFFEQDFAENKWVYKNNGVEMRLPIKTHEKTGEILPPMLTWNTWRSMLFILVLFTKNSDSPIVETTIQEFLLATGTPDTPQNRNEAQKLLKRELQTLSEIELQYKKGRYEFMKRHPFPDVSMKNGKIRIGLSPEFMEYLTKKTHFLMTLKTGILKLKSKSPAVNQLAYYLNLHRSNDNNIAAGTANILSVEECLRNCPSIPTIEEVRASRTSPDKRIIEMFNWCMDTAVEQGILEGWHYCLAKGEALNNPAVSGYDYFISLYIWFEFKNFPKEESETRAQDNTEKRMKRKERQERLTDAAIAKKRAEAAQQ